ncbi:MAG: hypothetical protein NZ734_09955 [Paracoccus sp.]|nr:hypothetical protein [Paracoccus sp. (in: a-proteobacteria)]
MWHDLIASIFPPLRYNQVTKQIEKLMEIGVERLLPVAILSALLAFSAGPSEAFIYRTFGGSGAAQDIAKKINEIIARLEDAAKSVLGEGNEALRNRLDQVDTIVDDALDQLALIPEDAESRILNVLRETETALSMLEKQFFVDVKEAIFEVECASTRFTLGTLQSGLGDVGDIIGTGKIKIRPPIPVNVGFFCRLSKRCSGDPEFEVALLRKSREGFIS